MNKILADTEKNMLKYNTMGSKIWTFFNSLKLTLFIFIFLAVISILGTVIQQNQPANYYTMQYGNRLGELILYTGVQDMYHSGWFQGMLVLLVVNIVVCTIERFPPKWKASLKVRDNINPRFIKNLSNNESLYISEDVNKIKEIVFNILRNKRYRVKETKTGGGVLFYATKGVAGRFGSDVVHVALLIVLLGALIGSIWGFRDFIVVYVGNTVKVPRTAFSIKLEKFWIDYYQTGQIKQYNSVLTVIDDDKEVIRNKHIWVNAPLHYKGMTFYQSSYGLAWDRIDEAQIVLKNGDSISSPVAVKWQQKADVPGGRYSVKLVGFVADFAYDPDKKMVFSKSGQSNNPAIQVEVYEGSRVISRPWLFLKYPELFPAIPDSKENLIFTNYRGIEYSGLSINRDPGAAIVWIGSSIMVIGFFLAFFIFHRRIWVVIKKGNNSTELSIGGMINKNRFSFNREFTELVNSIKKCI